MKNQTNFESVEYINIEAICQFLGLDFAQTKRSIQEDSILSESFRCIEQPVFSTISEDNPKKHIVKVWSLPVQFYFGWLLQIDPNAVSPDYKSALLEYQKQAHKILAEKIDLDCFF